MPPSSASSVPPASSTPSAPSSGSVAPSASSSVTPSSGSSAPPASSSVTPSSGSSVPPDSSTPSAPSSGSVAPSASSSVTLTSRSSVPPASSTPVGPSPAVPSGSSIPVPSGSGSVTIPSATITSSPSSPSAVPSGSSGSSLPLTTKGSASVSTSLVTSTEVVTQYTTYCPGPTTFTTNGVTYTVTEATTLTITDCPCTLTHTNTIVVPTTAEVKGTTAAEDSPQYCPGPTTFTTNGVTYTVTEATTLTITDCPCTLTHTNTIVVPTTAEVKGTTAAEDSPQGSNYSPSATAVTVKTASGNTPKGNHNAPSPAVSTSLVITTEVVTEYTTYCPSPTTFSTNGVTYTITEATTLTVTGPCTLTRTNTVVVPTGAEETGAMTIAPNAPQGNVPTTVTVTAGENSPQGINNSPSAAVPTTVTVTDIVSTLTTYCPGYTTFSTNGVSYTVGNVPTTVTVTAGENSPQGINNSPSAAVPTTVTVTDIVSTLTTYCPGYTTFSTNGVSYTVTEPTTLTITDCPCTVTRTSVFTEDATETVTAGPYFPISSGFAASNGTVDTHQYNQTRNFVGEARNNTTVTIFTTAPGAIHGSTSNVVKTIGQNNTVTSSSTQLKARAVTFTRSDSSNEHSTVPSVKSLTANAANRLLASPFLFFLGLLALW
ncbi:uncharacterized protein ZBAI_03515 [Zygosaccharomyces bailii ISA1307]|nr:uncharacterized protein ZBAI_03515 [Zygosaccharomyces bailii ISA1307]